MFLCAVFMIFGGWRAGVVTGMFEILSFTVYKLYGWYSAGTQIELTAYLWPFVLLLLLVGLGLFSQSLSATEATNSVLHQQVEELTVMDPLTGLENLRSMYANLGRTMSLSSRSGTPLALFLVRPRYAEELHHTLSAHGYEELRRRIAQIAENTLRLEDRVFSIDEDGSLGIFCFCDAPGAQTVRARLLDAFEDKNAFAEITDKPIHVGMRIAFLPYEKAYGTDPIGYRHRVESEMQYDV
jgi:GGDEF domain-containing protein